MAGDPSPCWRRRCPGRQQLNTGQKRRQLGSQTALTWSVPHQRQRTRCERGGWCLHWDGGEKMRGDNNQLWGLAWPLDSLCDFIHQIGSERCMSAKMAGLHPDGGKPSTRCRGFDLVLESLPVLTLGFSVSESTFVKCRPRPRTCGGHCGISPD